MSKEERVSWVSLVVNLVVAWMYFSHVLRMPAPLALIGAGFLITNIIIYAIFVGIAGEVALRWVQRRSGDVVDDRKAIRDERDEQIGLRSARNAYAVLMVVVAAAWGWIATAESGWWKLTHPGASTIGTVLDALLAGVALPSVIAQLLLAALALAGITVYASRVYYYRRGF